MGKSLAKRMVTRLMSHTAQWASHSRVICAVRSFYLIMWQETHLWGSLHITGAAVRGRSWGLLTQDTGSITRLKLTTNQATVAVTVALPLVCTDDAVSSLADTYVRGSCWLRSSKLPQGKSSLRFLLSIFCYLPPFLDTLFSQMKLMSGLDQGSNIHCETSICWANWMEGQEAAREVLPKRGLVYQVHWTLTCSIVFNLCHHKYKYKEDNSLISF